MYKNSPKDRSVSNMPAFTHCSVPRCGGGPPYPTRRGLVTAWQETKKLLHDESGRTMSGRT